MEVNFNRPLIMPNGTQIESETLANQLAQGISHERGEEGDYLKLWSFAQGLATSGALKLDAADMDTLKLVIKRSKIMSTLVKGQALLVIREAETQ